MDVHAVEEVAEPVVEAEEEQVIAPVVDVVEGQIDAPMMDMEEDLSVLFGDDDFEDDASDEFVLAVPPPSIYEVGGPFTATAEGPSFPQLVQRVIQGSDMEIAAGVIIGEIGPRVFDVAGKMQVIASHMIQAVDRVEQVGVQVELGQQTSTQRDEMVTGLTQQGEHADEVNFGIGETDCSLREKTTRTLDLALDKRETLEQPEDNYAIQSFERGIAAYDSRAFAWEIAHVKVPGPRGRPSTIVHNDDDLGKAINRNDAILMLQSYGSCDQLSRTTVAVLLPAIHLA
ncbi:hypothetical protein Tco_0568940 [Tanacetum coccineum]